MEVSKSDHGKALSALGASKGGKARARALTPQQRRDIARHAAASRWDQHLDAVPRETHTGILKIGDREIPCSVLDNGLRVFSARGVSRVVGSRSKGSKSRADDGAPQLPPFLASSAVRPFIPDDLLAPLISPIQFRPLHGGRTAYGYEATVLPRICEVILDATRGNAIRTATLAETAEVLLRGFAQVGIIALVDEATGYQDVRARDALAKILEAFVAKELRPWIKTFPPDFYKEMFRLRGMAYPPRVKKPRYVGLLTNNLVYARLAPGVLKELQERNPVLETGRRRHKHFQWLTEDLGHPKLKDHIVAITALMRASVNWQSFTELLERAFPKYKELPLYAAEIAEEEAQSEQEGAST